MRRTDTDRTDARKVTHHVPSEDLTVGKAGDWLQLDQLRALVQEADRLGWGDRSLVCLKSRAGEHPYRSDLRIVYALTLTGGPT